MRTGRSPDRVVRFPTLGSVISKELDFGESALPGFVAVNPFPAFNHQAYEAGFLGSKYSPLTIKPKEGAPAQNGYAELGVDDLKPYSTLSAQQLSGRLDLLQGLQAGLIDQ